MDTKFNIQDLAELVARKNKISRKEAETFVRTFFDTISTYLLREKIVKVKGLGTFKMVEVSDRESVDVNTGRRIMIEGHSKVSFTPDNTLRDQVNKPFCDFETVILNEDTDIAEMERIDTPIPVEDTDSIEKEHRITSALDAINRVYGDGTVRLAVQGCGRIKTTSANQSPHYTTLWSDIPKVSVK